MSEPNRRFATVLAATLADCGVRHVCVSPGSRNTPLIAGFAAEDRLQKWTLLDERSAGFFAIGLARVTGTPVVISCTSGTAAAEYHPAVVEASQSHVPLLVLTADRPEELRNVGAPQTIDQLSLYGSSTKLFIDAPPPGPTSAVGHASELAVRAWTAATTGTPGPVHLNLPFREPLLGKTESIANPPVPVVTAAEVAALDLANVAGQFDGRKGIIVAGRSDDPEFASACADLAAATGWPIFADPLSGIRHGTHPLDRVLAYGDLLATAGALEQLKPEIVARFGPVPTSKPVWRWLEDHPEIDQILIDPEARDATNSATTTVAVPVTAAARALVGDITAPAPSGWAESWAAVDEAAGHAVEAELQSASFPNEPVVALEVVASAPAGSIVTVGSSMPIRDVDTFSGKSATSLRIIGNRGTNGIDGIVSAALGTAASGSTAFTLVGDVSLFHDINALGSAVQLGLPLTIVVVNNDGGGIFHFLPHHDPAVLPPETFDRYLATPHGTDFVPIAAAFGLDAYDVSNHEELTRLLRTPAERPRLIQVKTDRNLNLQLHRSVAAAVELTLGGCKKG
ncbi:MAG: 2-succinyl-5-enolpyruvyl-6-hydroxy-3-cyclohexene-1-carboxylic-acid synthase [bacterium]|nr:2-succinyl-5-enolpyruvyl-6-hydroxy-3-cyclohexene-1-carboxylic-acid synthase [bacterium]